MFEGRDMQGRHHDEVRPKTEDGKPLTGNRRCEAPAKRRGRESNPRIAVLQTAALPLGYPARSKGPNSSNGGRNVNRGGPEIEG